MFISKNQSDGMLLLMFDCNKSPLDGSRRKGLKWNTKRTSNSTASAKRGENKEEEKIAITF